MVGRVSASQLADEIMIHNFLETAGHFSFRASGKASSLSPLLAPLFSIAFPSL